MHTDFVEEHSTAAHASNPRSCPPSCHHVQEIRGIDYNLTMETHFILSQNQQHDLEVKIETQKSHRKHFETRLRELQDSIRTAEREHAAMNNLVKVNVVEQCCLRLKKIC